MVKQLDDWIDDDEHPEVVPKGKQKPRPSLAEDLDVDETSEWRLERGTRGRKPADKKHRPRRSDHDDEF